MLDQMSFDRFAALQQEWLRRPPAHWLIARFLGHEPPEEVEYMTPEAARAWFAATGGRIEGVAKIG